MFSLNGTPKWYYHLKLGTLDGIGNFTCSCKPHTNESGKISIVNIEYIGLKKSGKCPLPEENGYYCSAIYTTYLLFVH